VNARTSTYASEFTSLLWFDGELYPHDPYDAAILLAFDTTFGGATGRNATWMDKHYDWSNSDFKSRAAESINLAANYLADVLHGFWLAAGQPIVEFQLPLITLAVAVLVVLVATRPVRQRRPLESCAARSVSIKGNDMRARPSVLSFESGHNRGPELTRIVARRAIDSS